LTKWAPAGYGPPVLESMQNVDDRTVEGFGDECSRFDQSAVSDTEQGDGLDSYFRIFPWGELGRAPARHGNSPPQH
jgi:hypothetical protein